MTPEKFITLTKKEETTEGEDINIRPFDDGLYFDFGKLIKPKQISFECKTDRALEAESCDFRIFAMDKEKTLFEAKENSWEQAEIF